MPDRPSGNTDVTKRLSAFKLDLASRTTGGIVQRYITFGDCFALIEEQYFDLKQAIADKFDIYPNEVVVVGSGKTGFSIKPNKRYAPFGEESDIDVAIVSPSLFERYWQAVYDYKEEGNYWPDEATFSRYLLRGWIRPDKLPAENFELRNQWWEFFRSLTSSRRFGSYGITCGLYRSWYYLHRYHTIAVEKCKAELAEVST